MQVGFDAFYETEVPEAELIISRTDLKGFITYANETFAQISGYTIDELIGKPHNIVRHKDMPKSVFKTLWETIQSGKKWEGAVKNRRSDGGYYWVWAEVSGVEKDGKVVEYKSMRYPMSIEDKKKYQKLYESLKEKEENECFATFYLPCSKMDEVKEFLKNLS
ncbi:MAG: PAS domain-containing protein [Sulfurospirillaceae bacterium]|jgi:aerotaxis receptor|nr:PAS domain-containing protein [Sulfurospirillaceae bacterium]MCK9546636.1 PAS domain-containing protein [Sulfurospirillaceae bacterium]MDY0237700.1 PAS domain-containing protein [Campylobacterales bacterium]NLM99840.1 PAS domain-containing protein [Campylobacteraceae bacterium]